MANFPLLLMMIMLIDSMLQTAAGVLGVNGVRAQVAVARDKGNSFATDSVTHRNPHLVLIFVKYVISPLSSLCM